MRSDRLAISGDTQVSSTKKLWAELVDRMRKAASKQLRTSSDAVRGNVLTCSAGAARVDHANTAIRGSSDRFQLQRACNSGGHHPALPLLCRRRGDYSVAFHSSGVFSRSRRGASGKIQATANAG